MSLKIYIETTIPSFYFETRRNVECVSRRNWTRRWWDDHRHEHQLATSLVVRDELSDPKYPEAKRRSALALLDELPLLDIDARIDEISRPTLKSCSCRSNRSPMPSILHSLHFINATCF